MKTSKQQTIKQRKMNRFIKNLSANGDDVLIKRAENIGEQTRIAYQGIINQLTTKKKQLELEKADLEDMAPDTSDSLRPSLTPHFNPMEWCRRIQGLSEEIYNIDMNLKIAKENYTYFFDDLKEEKKGK